MLIENASFRKNNVNNCISLSTDRVITCCFGKKLEYFHNCLHFGVFWNNLLREKISMKYRSRNDMTI